MPNGEEASVLAPAGGPPTVDPGSTAGREGKKSSPLTRPCPIHQGPRPLMHSTGPVPFPPPDPSDFRTLRRLECAANGAFAAGRDGVRQIWGTHDGRVEFLVHDRICLAWINSGLGHPAAYPLLPARVGHPLEAILMDLDGTTVKSEEFWEWIIEQTTARLLGDPRFRLQEEDAAHVSGHSVSEHLAYCIGKYCPGRTVEEARAHYYDLVHRELALIAEGRGRTDAFHPADGLKDFLLAVKGRGVKLGLVTSGLHEKAWPGIVAVFRQLGLGNPAEFYDTIITAGQALRPGQAGTLGELEIKPHPWLYAEAARVGLGIDPARRHHVVGIEDSGAGICSVRLAGFAAIGVEGGNIHDSGTASLCHALCPTLTEAGELLFGG